MRQLSLSTAILLAGCAQPSSGVAILQPLAVRPWPDGNPGAYELSLRTASPTTLEVRVDDGVNPHVVTYRDATDTHLQPLLGVRPDRRVRLDATLTDPDGWTTELPPLRFRSDPIDLPLPGMVVTALGDPEPGFTLVPATDLERGFLLAVDHEGEAVWALSSVDVKGHKLHGDAELAYISHEHIVRTTVMGGWSVTYGDSAGESGLDYDIGKELHHEPWPVGDTITALARRRIDVPEYPVAPDEPLSFAPASILADEVVRFSADGTVLSELPLDELLDTRRVGYGGVEGLFEDDWSHTNALVPYQSGSEPRLLLSVRHQDALISVSLGDPPRVEWILSNPDGWRAPWSSLRLQPADDGVTWPYHQHAPFVRTDGDELRVLVFDNGNFARTTPYRQDPDPDGNYSRLVEYRIDERAMRVWQVAEIRGDGQRDLFSHAMGNVDVLPTTGHLFATYTFLSSRRHYPGLGLGKVSTRAIELDPATGGLVWDLHVVDPSARSARGWTADRIVRVPHLYGDLATVEWEPR